MTSEAQGLFYGGIKPRKRIENIHIEGTSFILEVLVKLDLQNPIVFRGSDEEEQCQRSDCAGIIRSGLDGNDRLEL